MDQFDQLLTCCVCLDRYRTPKVLPCQHSYCMEPCMEGLVDYVKRQVKCPECRKEHRLPMNGIADLPTNMTLQRFLDLHADITGELPDTKADAVMSRCNVCSEKAYVSLCGHCNRKLCSECKEAHCNALKAEIGKLNTLIRNAWQRLEDAVRQVEHNRLQLDKNAENVVNEINEISRRLSNALNERTQYLRSCVENYVMEERSHLKELKSNLELELANMQSNSELMERHLNDTPWDENELVDCKEIFLKMKAFLKSVEAPSSDDYVRRIRLIDASEVSNDLAKRIFQFGELKFQETRPSNGLSVHHGMEDESDLLVSRGSSALSRSKSDHRLAAEFAAASRRRADDPSPGRRRLFGDGRIESASRRRGYEDNDNDDLDLDRATRYAARGSRFRSRFLRSDNDDLDNNDDEGNKNNLENKKKSQERSNVLETEDASRGPITGCIRLADSARVIQKLKEQEVIKRRPPKPKEEVPKFKPYQPPLRPSELARLQAQQQQQREQEEQQARQQAEQPTGQQEETTTTTEEAVSNVTATTSTTNEASGEAEQEEVEEEAEEEEDEYEDYEYEEEEEEEEETSTPSVLPTTTTTTATSVASTSITSVSLTPSYTCPSSVTSPSRPPTSILKTSSTQPLLMSTPSQASSTSTTSSSRREEPLKAHTSHQTWGSKAAMSSSGEPESHGSASHYESSSRRAATLGDSQSRDLGQSASSLSTLTARGFDSRGRSDSLHDWTNDGESSMEPSRYASRRPLASRTRDSGALSFVDRYLEQHRQTPPNSSNGFSSGTTALALARSRSTAVVAARAAAANPIDSDNDSDKDSDNDNDNDSQLRVLRSSSKKDNDDDPTPFTSRYGAELARSKSSHLLKRSENEGNNKGNTRGQQPPLSSWAKYLKSKYGNRSGNTHRGQSFDSVRRSSVYDDHHDDDDDDDDDDEDDDESKTRLVFSIGKRGNQNGCFTWPRGIANGPQDQIVVADSSNHRVQVFDCQRGRHVMSFGSYGNSDGEFDCLAGVAVNRTGQFVIADRYNHRVQVFDCSGRFLRSIGSQGSGLGEFSYPWGLTTDSLGFIYVCDKENHRVQIFQADGSFVGRFGSEGRSVGQLQHPHYVAVCKRTNHVIVSDANNHRMQIFDVNGKVVSHFGNEGTDKGKFKFPRGVAVDSEGCIAVADSGNNRVQLFDATGRFIRAFGRWGAENGQFKGLEGVAINGKRQILVADRENHRVQVFEWNETTYQ